MDSNFQQLPLSGSYSQQPHLNSYLQSQSHNDSALTPTQSVFLEPITHKAYSPGSRSKSSETIKVRNGCCLKSPICLRLTTLGDQSSNAKEPTNRITSLDLNQSNVRESASKLKKRTSALIRYPEPKNSYSKLLESTKQEFLIQHSVIPASSALRDCNQSACADFQRQTDACDSEVDAKHSQCRRYLIGKLYKNSQLSKDSEAHKSSSQSLIKSNQSSTNKIFQRIQQLRAVHADKVSTTPRYISSSRIRNKSGEQMLHSDLQLVKSPQSVIQPQFINSRSVELQYADLPSNQGVQTKMSKVERIKAFEKEIESERQYEMRLDCLRERDKWIQEKEIQSQQIVQFQNFNDSYQDLQPKKQELNLSEQEQRKQFMRETVEMMNKFEKEHPELLISGKLTIQSDQIVVKRELSSYSNQPPLHQNPLRIKNSTANRIKSNKIENSPSEPQIIESQHDKDQNYNSNFTLGGTNVIQRSNKSTFQKSADTTNHHSPFSLGKILNNDSCQDSGVGKGLFNSLEPNIQRYPSEQFYIDTRCEQLRSFPDNHSPQSKDEKLIKLQKIITKPSENVRYQLQPNQSFNESTNILHQKQHSISSIVQHHSEQESVNHLRRKSLDSLSFRDQPQFILPRFSHQDDQAYNLQKIKEKEKDQFSNGRTQTNFEMTQGNQALSPGSVLSGMNFQSNFGKRRLEEVTSVGSHQFREIQGGRYGDQLDQILADQNYSPQQNNFFKGEMSTIQVQRFVFDDPRLQNEEPMDYYGNGGFQEEFKWDMNSFQEEKTKTQKIIPKKSLKQISNSLVEARYSKQRTNQIPTQSLKRDEVLGWRKDIDGMQNKRQKGSNNLNQIYFDPPYEQMNTSGDVPLQSSAFKNRESHVPIKVKQSTRPQSQALKIEERKVFEGFEKESKSKKNGFADKELKQSELKRLMDLQVQQAQILVDLQQNYLHSRSLSQSHNQSSVSSKEVRQATLDLIQQIFRQMERINRQIEKREKLDKEKYQRIEKKITRLVSKYKQLKLSHSNDDTSSVFTKTQPKETHQINRGKSQIDEFPHQNSYLEVLSSPSHNKLSLVDSKTTAIHQFKDLLNKHHQDIHDKELVIKLEQPLRGSSHRGPGRLKKEITKPLRPYTSNCSNRGAVDNQGIMATSQSDFSRADHENNKPLAHIKFQDEDPQDFARAGDQFQPLSTSNCEAPSSASPFKQSFGNQFPSSRSHYIKKSPHGLDQTQLIQAVGQCIVGSLCSALLQNQPGIIANKQSILNQLIQPNINQSLSIPKKIDNRTQTYPGELEKVDQVGSINLMRTLSDEKSSQKMNSIDANPKCLGSRISTIDQINQSTDLLPEADLKVQKLQEVKLKAEIIQKQQVSSGTSMSPPRIQEGLDLVNSDLNSRATNPCLRGYIPLHHLTDNMINCVTHPPSIHHHHYCGYNSCLQDSSRPSVLNHSANSQNIYPSQLGQGTLPQSAIRVLTQPVKGQDDEVRVINYPISEVSQFNQETFEQATQSGTANQREVSQILRGGTEHLHLVVDKQISSVGLHLNQDNFQKSVDQKNLSKGQEDVKSLEVLIQNQSDCLNQLTHPQFNAQVYIHRGPQTCYNSTQSLTNETNAKKRSKPHQVEMERKIIEKNRNESTLTRTTRRNSVTSEQREEGESYTFKKKKEVRKSESRVQCNRVVSFNIDSKIVK